ncbi:MAG: site-2 protease family protein [Pirellulales bacterium]
MFFSEPPQTGYDLRFHIGPIPVRVHPLFWLISLLMGANLQDPKLIALWIGVSFLSILVHELGHALAMIRYGERPRVVLYGMGGLAISDGGGTGGWARSKLVTGGRRARVWLEQVIISAAGPGAGFFLAIFVVVLIHLLGGSVSWDAPTLARPIGYRIELDNPTLSLVAWMMLRVNIFWGLINLLPILPLDGGQIARAVFVERDPWRGMERAIWLSVFTGGGVALVAFAVWHDFFLAIMIGSLAASNYAALQRRW